MTKATENDGSMLADPSLLEKIDKLFACNVGEYINLPQLVVVGDQSSGKSSVLEGLTKLSFPRDSDFCIRFATQIIFRRDTKVLNRDISASIIPASDLQGNDEQRLRAWKAAGLQALSENGFLQMMKEVHQVMGLSDSDSDGKPTFSNSVLHLEICGPQDNHLSVIDVPGIFKNTTPGRTSKTDILRVRNMVLRYMQNRRSVLLTVVPANVDIATQEIIEMAREIDPEGMRTLRILTKPDLVDKGAEKKVVEMIEDRNDSSQLGWILVRNLNQHQLDDRDILLLSAERETSVQQRTVLLGIVSSFQKTTQLALSTDHSVDESFDSDEEVRLATRISDRNSSFASHITNWGHEYAFNTKTSGTPGQVTTEEHNSLSVEASGEAQPITTDEIKDIGSREIEADEDTQDILYEAVKLRPAHSGISNWIIKIHREARGFEIGTFNPALLSTLIKKQSAKWPILTQGYISDVIAMVHRFINKALRAACGDKRISDKLIAPLWDDLMGKYRQGLLQVDFLLSVEREEMPMTLNHYLNDNLQKLRQKRIQDKLHSKKLISIEHGAVVRLTDLSYHGNMSNTEHTTQDIHDILQSYYKVALKRFVDNVCMQAANHFLFSGPETPMRLFSSLWVNGLSDKKLEDLVGEEAKTKRRRRGLKKKIDELEAGRKVLMA